MIPLASAHCSKKNTLKDTIQNGQGNSLKLSDVVCLPEFYELSVESLIALLNSYTRRPACSDRSDSTTTHPSSSVHEPADRLLKACILWVEHDRTGGRRRHLPALMERGGVYVARCSPHYVAHLASPRGGHEYTFAACSEQVVRNVVNAKKKAHAKVTKSSTSELLLFGGYIEKDAIAEKINKHVSTWRRHRWRTLRDFPRNYNKYAACVCGDHLVVTGGKLGSAPASATFVLNTVKNRWTRISDLTRARCCHGTVSVGTTVYVFGGSSKGHALHSVEAMDLGAGVENAFWSTRAPLPVPLINPMVIAMHELVYVIERRSLKSTSKDQQIPVFVYDTVFDRWIAGPSLPARVRSTTGTSAVAVSSGAIYLMGGEERLCERYDPATRRWESRSRPRGAHQSGAAVATAPGRVLLFGGRGSGAAEYDSVVEEYDVQTDTWTDTAEWSLPAPGWFMFAAYVNVK